MLREIVCTCAFAYCIRIGIRHTTDESVLLLTQRQVEAIKTLGGRDGDRYNDSVDGFCKRN